MKEKDFTQIEDEINNISSLVKILNNAMLYNEGVEVFVSDYINVLDIVEERLKKITNMF